MKRAYPWLAVILIVSFAVPASAAITKGPYLQKPEPTGMTICLESDQALPAVVEVGFDASYGEEFTGEGDPFTYDGETVYQYRVAVTDREPDTVYHYRVKVGDAVSGDYTFITEPDELRPFRFVVMGDMRGGSVTQPNVTHEQLAAAAFESEPDLYFNTGDLISNGADLDDWEYFFVAEHELLAYAPLFAAFGNHEDNEEGDLSGAEIWARFLDTPHSGNHPRWFSFDYVNVHFTVVDIESWETLILPNQMQNGWLRDDLAAAAADPKINFIFTFFHQPPYSYVADRTGNIAALLLIQPLLQRNGVPISFEGHDHLYARQVIGGVQHVVTGGGGAPLYDPQTFPPPESYPGFQAVEKINHYIVVDVDTDRVDVTAYRLDGSLLDTFTIEADPPEWPDDDDDNDDTAPDDDDDDDDDDDNDDNDDDDNDAAAPNAEADDDEGGCGCS